MQCRCHTEFLHAHDHEVSVHDRSRAENPGRDVDRRNEMLRLKGCWANEPTSSAGSRYLLEEFHVLMRKECVRNKCSAERNNLSGDGIWNRKGETGLSFPVQVVASLAHQFRRVYLHKVALHLMREALGCEVLE